MFFSMRLSSSVSAVASSSMAIWQEVEILFNGLLSWWATPAVRVPIDDSFFDCTSWSCLRSSSRTMVLKASMTCCISSLVSITSMLLKRPRTMSSVALLMIDNGLKILEIISRGRTMPSATATADQAISCFFRRSRIAWI